MPNYRFTCPRCAYSDLFYYTFDDISKDAYEECPKCRSTMERIYGFSFFRRSMPAHFNTSVGKVVNTEREFADDLKRKSDETAERLGMPVNFQPVDPNDKQTLGVTDEGLDSTYDAEVAAGKQETKKWY